MYSNVQKRKSSGQHAPGITMPHEDEESDVDTSEPLHDSRRPSPVQMPMSPFKRWGARHTLTLLGFLGFASSYSMRVNLSIAIVQMVNSSHASHHNHSGGGITCPELSVRDDGVLEVGGVSKFPRFGWSSHEQGIILGSFFYGYVATQVPGGMLANRVGGKWVFGLGMLVTAVFSLVTPLAANAGIGYLVAVRVIQGLGEGVTNPSMHALLAQWVPPLERSMLGAFVYAGAQIGTVVALPVSGWLLGNEDGGVMTGGWPSVFYVFGLLGIVWFLFWAFLVYDSPSCHPRISVEEMLYIQGGGKTAQVGKGRGTPWRKILVNPAVIAILVVQTGHGWGLYTMLTELPTYMDDVLHFDIKENAYLSAVPYLLMFLVSIVSSVWADRLRARGVRTGVVRKIFNTIAHWVPAVLLVLAAHSACDRTLTVTLITLAIGINGAAWASFQVNHLDLSGNFAPILMGITNGFANLCGIGAPYVAGVILNDGSTIARWRIIFYIAAAVYFIDNIVYLVLASGETQEWDSQDERSVFREGVGIESGDAAVRRRGDEDREPLLEP